MRTLAILVVLNVLLLAAGCLEADGPPTQSKDAEPRVSITEFPVELEHDHTDGTLHDARFGLELVTHTSTAMEPYPEAPVYNLAIAGDILVASLGTFAPSPVTALTPPMGLLVADVKDPANLEVLSVTHLPGAGVEAVTISPDARFAFLGTEFEGAVGIWTVDLGDPTAPVIQAFTPQPTEGPHNLRYGVIGERHFVFASVSHVSTPGAAAGQGQDPLPVLDLRVDIYEFDLQRPELPLTLVSDYKALDNEGLPNGATIVHDAIFQVHPITNQPLLYVAHWDRGVRIVDLTSPESPKEIGKYVEPAPTDFLTIHTVKPHPTLIDGRHLTVATAQCAYKPASVCYVRFLDTTDPSNPVQVSTWTLPEEVHGGIYTTEIFDLADGVLYQPWGHAGLWKIDIGTWDEVLHPEASGYFFPNQPRAGGGLAATTPFANAVAIKDGHAILAEVGTGLYVVEPSSPQ